MGMAVKLVQDGSNIRVLRTRADGITEEPIGHYYMMPGTELWSAHTATWVSNVFESPWDAIYWLTHPVSLVKDTVV